MKLLVNAVMLSGHLGGIGQYTYHLLLHLRRVRPQWSITLAIGETIAKNFRSIDGLEIMEICAQSRAARFIHHHVLLRFACKKFDLLHSIGNIGMIGCPIPQVITKHDCYEVVSAERFNPYKRKAMKALISQSGREARALITISQNSLKDIVHHYPQLQGKVQVIYCGSRFPVIRNTDSRAHFLFVGTLEPGKNLALLLRAMAALPRRDGVRLKVVGGQGWRQTHLASLIDELKIQDRVDFLGYVTDSDLAQLYFSSMALVLPSNYEGFGLPAIEAMACGCPVIAADNSSLPEAGGDAALYFKTEDLADLVRQMERMLQDADLRRECSERGYKHAERFRWEKTAEDTALCFEKALES